jgi:hypothetical protein
LEHESGVTQFEFTREGALGFGIKRSSTRVLDSDGGGDGVSSGGGGNSGDNGQKKGMIVIIHVAAGGQAANLGLTVRKLLSTLYFSLCFFLCSFLPSHCLSSLLLLIFLNCLHI